MEPEYWAPPSCTLDFPEDLTDWHHRAATQERLYLGTGLDVQQLKHF